MASLLVYIELAELGRMFDRSRRDSGGMWQLRRAMVGPELDRLDDEATLFVSTTDRGKPTTTGEAIDSALVAMLEESREVTIVHTAESLEP